MPRKGANPPSLNQQEYYDNILVPLYRPVIQFILDLQYRDGFVRPIFVTNK